MGQVYNSWVQNAHNTYDFQAPTGDGEPYALYFDAGIIAKDAKPLITSNDSHGSPIVNSNYLYIGGSRNYPDLENGYWENGVYKYLYKPIKFYTGQVVSVFGYKSVTINDQTIIYKIFYYGRILNVYQPSPSHEDGTFDDSAIFVKCLKIVTDTLPFGESIDYWTIDYPGSPYAYYNYVQNYNDRSKLAISGGSAKFDFNTYYETPDMPPVTETDGDPSTFNYTQTTTYYYGGRFEFSREDEKHKPWSGITVGVSHLITTTNKTEEYNPTLITVEGQPDENGAYTNYAYVENDYQVSYDYEQEETNNTYEFDAGDYDLYLQTFPENPDYDPNANFIDLGGELVGAEIDSTGVTENVGSYGEYFVCDEYDPDTGECVNGHLVGFDNRDESHFRDVITTTSRILRGDQTDFDLKTVDEETGQQAFNYESPYWIQQPDGQLRFATSDKYDFPDPKDFFYYKPTN